MKEIDIIRLSFSDITNLQKIGRETFYETFSPYNSQENMKKYLEEEFSIEKLTRELNNKSSEFYFAIFEKNIIGYLKLNFWQAQTELKDKNALEIERIYVLKGFHGKNVGQLLCEKAIDTARDKNLNYVWLGVWEKNLRAINFYKKNGFVEFNKHFFVLGNEKQTDILMKLNMKNKK